MAHTLPELAYDYSALEPYISTDTLRIHHDIHHRTYVEKLNSSLERCPYFQFKSIETLLSQFDELPEDVVNSIRQYGGAHFNHSLLWEVLSPAPNGQPQGDFRIALEKQLKGFEAFKAAFAKQVNEVVGSGYVWLCINPCQELVLLTTENEDCPLLHGLKPLFGVDLWEHAYHQKYRDKRLEYLENIWHLVNWRKVEELWKRYSELYTAVSATEEKIAS